MLRETPGQTLPGTTATSPVTTKPAARECVRVTGGTGPVNTGGPATDALFLAGEIFVCADDVVVVGADDLNEVSAAAQLAAALGGPLLFPHDQLAAEIGRLKPVRVHLVGSVSVTSPPNAQTLIHTPSDALEYAREALGVTVEIILPSVPDASTVVHTVLAVAQRDRVVAPPGDPVGTTASTVPDPVIDPAELVTGLAVPSASETIWMVSSSDPVTILLASATGRSVGATVVAVDSEDPLRHPEVSTSLAGRPKDAIRFVGSHPAISDWELGVLVNGHQIPGGGYYVLPAEKKRRFVAFYGHPDTPGLGVLGEQGPEATLQRMETFLSAYQGDGSETIPVFEIIASVASAGPTQDGDYSEEWPSSTFAEWFELAEANGVYIVLDLQPGRDDFLTQAKQYEELLKLPFVGLALDPEWRLAPNQVHLRQTGSVEAEEVNQVIDWLADLVKENGLPQKMLILHQCRLSMIQNRELLKERPELQLIIQMDGDGTEAQKDATYRKITAGTEDVFWSWGWKNFFDEDEPGPPSPENTMSKGPVPVYVSYQ